MSNLAKKIDTQPNTLGEFLVLLKEQESLTPQEKIRNILDIRMSQYNDIDLDESDLKKLYTAFLSIESGTASGIVAMCSKSKCVYRGRCALYCADKAPEGYECLHENKILMDSMDRYMSTFDIKEDNYSELVLINQLVEYEILEHRCNSILANDHIDLKMESVIGIDEAGRLITKQEISHALNIKMQIQKAKVFILQEFTATRKEKYKKQAALKLASEGPMKLISGMKSKIQKLKEGQIESQDVKDKLEHLEDLG